MNRANSQPSLPFQPQLHGYVFDASRRIWAKPGDGAFSYSDGDEVEQRIGAAIEGSEDVSLFSPELRKHQTDWPSIYHLSPVRANLLRPTASLLSGARILEIGAGCGAITRFLGEQGAHVVALEGSARRASITASRCRELERVLVVRDRFAEFATEQRFDVVTLIGVLEYARLYSDDPDPVQETLRKARSLLSDRGVLLVAIENQLGLKYFAGAPEDHLGRPMAGIQDNYPPGGVVTFGKQELGRRMRDAGFTNVEFALPFPDYKLPQTVVLPAGYADGNGFDAASLAGQAAHADPQVTRPLFAQGPAFRVAARNGLLADIANSFLVMCGKSDEAPRFADAAPDVLAAHYAANRPARYTKGASFLRNEQGNIHVRRAPLSASVHDASTQEALIAQVLDNEDYFAGTNWGDRFEALVSKPGWSVDDLVPWILRWRDAVAAVASVVPEEMTIETPISGRLFDAVPRNLIVDGDESRFFDLEWHATSTIPFGHLVCRALQTALAHLSSVATPADPILLHFPTFARALCRHIGLLITNTDLERYLDAEASYQDCIHGLLRRAPATTALDEMMVPALPDLEAWTGDQTASLRQALDALHSRDTELAGMREQQGAAEHSLESLRAHVRELETAVFQAQMHGTQKADDLATQLQDLSDRLQDALSQGESSISRAAQAEQRLTEMEYELVRAGGECQLLHSAIADKDNEINRLWLQIGTLQSAVDNEAALNSVLRNDLREANGFQETSMHTQKELELIRNSLSWKITAPARAANRIRRAITLHIRNRFAQAAEGVYRRMPLPQSRKQALKGALFKAAGGLIRNTRAYQRWEAYERMHGAQPAHPSPLALRPRLAEQAPVFAQAREPILWQADGVSEWAEYGPLRDRINAKALEERERNIPKPRPMLAYSGRDPHKVAAGIRLPTPVDAPDVSILIPVYNHLATTLECLASIAATIEADGPSFEILIADDASTDETAAVLATIPGIRLISQATNLGFLRNCNNAASHAHGRTLLLLNNDVQVTRGWLSAMLSCLESNDRIGAVGPKIVYPNGRLQEAGATLNRDGTAQMVGLNERPDLACYSFSREVDYCSGACLLLRTSDFANLGGFDDRYAPAYCEDSDLCMRLREAGKRIMFCAEAEVVHHLSKTSNDLDNDYKLACISRNLQTFASTWQDRLDEMDSVRTIAFYLPQFHPIAQNDLWWGRGFTEWSNVTKARPNFIGHYQPRVPADLGYYDLRVPEVMRHQAELAKRYGIGGFCFYYYWFAGQRLLEAPIERMLESNDPGLPFCLCWANENWTRRWDGQQHEVLMAQHHSREDDLAVIRDLMRYFANPNYIRVNGRPLLLVYRVALFPDFAETARLWRETCMAEGIGEIYLAQVESFELTSAGVKPAHFGCDAAVEFPPHGMAETYPLQAPLLNPDYRGAVADYRDLAVRYATRPFPDYKRFAGVMPSWDNTARRQDHSYVFEHSSPGAFQAWLETTISRTKQQYCGDERLIFINAWNEWAEGAYLEPDRRFGHAYLEAVRNALDASRLKRHDTYSLGA